MGGAVAAIEEGWMQSQIEEAAYVEAKRQAEGTSVVVGVNRFAGEDQGAIPVLEVDPALEEEQRGRLARWRAGRAEEAVERALASVEVEAGSTGNLLYPIKAALREGATVGEVSNRLRAVFGVYRPS
jgi:methylmalonyl-CoA mutase N-terminal domain/subunit